MRRPRRRGRGNPAPSDARTRWWRRFCRVLDEMPADVEVIVTHGCVTLTDKGTLDRQVVGTGYGEEATHNGPMHHTERLLPFGESI